jgi:hypothetical protein
MPRSKILIVHRSWADGLSEAAVGPLGGLNLHRVDAAVAVQTDHRRASFPVGHCHQTSLTMRTSAQSIVHLHHDHPVALTICAGQPNERFGRLKEQTL